MQQVQEVGLTRMANPSCSLNAFHQVLFAGTNAASFFLFDDIVEVFYDVNERERDRRQQGKGQGKV